MSAYRLGRSTLGLIFSALAMTLLAGCGGETIVSTNYPEPTYLDLPGQYNFRTIEGGFVDPYDSAEMYEYTIYYPTYSNGTPNITDGPYPIYTYSPGYAANMVIMKSTGEHLSTHGYIVMIFIMVCTIVNLK